MQEERFRENYAMRALYAFAILFVVDGHSPLADLLDFGGLYAYYSFHLLLFAFGSGYFFRLHGSPARDLLHRARRLLLPLYCWNLAYGLLAALLRRFGGFQLGQPLSAYTLLLAPLADGEHFVLNLGAWYLFPLFLVQAAYAGLRRISRLWREREGLTFLFCLVPGMVAVFLMHRGVSRPLWLLRALALLPGYAGGVLYRRRLEARDTLPTLPYLFGLTLARALLLARFGSLSYLLSSGTWFSQGPVLTYLQAALAIAFWLRLARLAAPAMKKSRLALCVSRHTMDIMLHHYLGFLAVSFVFLVLNRLGLGAADFSVRSLRTQSGYVYAPGGQGWAFLYLTAGLLFPLCIALPLERIKRRLRGAPSET